MYQISRNEWKQLIRGCKSSAPEGRAERRKSLCFLVLTLLQNDFLLSFVSRFVKLRNGRRFRISTISSSSAFAPSPIYLSPLLALNAFLFVAFSSVLFNLPSLNAAWVSRKKGYKLCSRFAVALHACLSGWTYFFFRWPISIIYEYSNHMLLNK